MCKLSTHRLLHDFMQIQVSVQKQFILAYSKRKRLPFFFNVCKVIKEMSFDCHYKKKKRIFFRGRNLYISTISNLLQGFSYQQKFYPFMMHRVEEVHTIPCFYALFKPCDISIMEAKPIVLQGFSNLQKLRSLPSYSIGVKKSIEYHISMLYSILEISLSWKRIRRFFSLASYCRII